MPVQPPSKLLDSLRQYMYTETILDGMLNAKSLLEWSHYWTLYSQGQTTNKKPKETLIMPLTAFHKINLSGRFVFECSYDDCSKTFTRRAENARAHWLMHNNIEPFKCNACQKGYRRRHDISRHCCIGMGRTKLITINF
jgi:hypothetical protein